MISLRKHIDCAAGDSTEDPALRACRVLLLAAGRSGERAVPELGRSLERKLTGLAKWLTPQVTSETVAKVSESAKAELSAWSDEAFLRHEASERDLRNVVGVMTRTIQSVTERDQRYTREIGEATKKLRSIAGSNDLAAMSHALLETANSLGTCIERIAEDGRQSLLRLSTEVDGYRARLEKSEQLSCQDPLTGLANRRCFEEQLEEKIQAAKNFCLILIDLNGFKEINDRFGHLAGDGVLRNFATRLRRQFPSADLVARWGGDEFAVIIACNRKDAEARVHRIRRAVLGEYKVDVTRPPVVVSLDASIGVVEWNGQETGAAMLARADQYMYLGKNPVRNARAI